MATPAYRVLHIVHSNQRRGAEVFAAQLASCIEGKGLFKNGVCILYAEDGECLPVGKLPVFSVDTEAEAEKLVSLVANHTYRDEPFARELAAEQTLDNLWDFAQRVMKAHTFLAEREQCECDPKREEWK